MSRAPGRLGVGRLRPGEQDLLRRMYDAYLEEITSFGASYRRGSEGRWEYRPGPDGRWKPDHLPYWLETGPDHQILLLRAAREVVGFAMVGVRPAQWMSPGRDACIAEFYVVPEARRRGFGEAAARRIFDRFPGRWEVCEVPGNAPAIAFWRRTVGRYTGDRFEELESRGGPAQHFTSVAPRQRPTRPARKAPAPPGAAPRPRATRRSRGGARAPRR